MSEQENLWDKSEQMNLREAQELVADWRFGDSEQQRIARTIVAVGKVADLLDQMATDNGKLADPHGGEYAKGKSDAYAKASELIREALGEAE